MRVQAAADVSTYNQQRRRVFAGVSVSNYEDYARESDVYESRMNSVDVLSNKCSGKMAAMSRFVYLHVECLDLCVVNILSRIGKVDTT